MTNKLIIIFCFLLTLQVQSETVYDSASGYTKNEILFMKWGDGEDEIGLKEKEVEHIYGRTIQKEIVRTTPSDIKIDGKGNIYFADVVKRKAVKYNPQSKEIEKFESNEGFLKIAVDKEEECLYIFNSRDNSVDIISPVKNRVRRIDNNINEDLVRSDIKIKNKVLFSKKKKIISFNEADTTNMQIPEEIIQEYDLNSKNSLIKYKGDKYPDPTGIIFHNLKQIDAACDEILFKTNLDLLYYEFISIDKNKNIYYLFEKDSLVNKPLKGREYAVIKINIIECKVNIIIIEVDKFTGSKLGVMPSRYIDVDVNGNIYQLINKDDGVHVLCWSK